jgi:hypothetical protein
VKPPKERKGALTSERQTPEKRKFTSVFEERNQTIKEAVKEYRKPLSEAIDYTVRIEEWRSDYSFGLNPSYNPLHRNNGISYLYEEPYTENRDLVLSGYFLSPQN